MPGSFKYTFILDHGRERTFELTLDPTSLGLLHEDGESVPGWAVLSCCQCPNCPLDQAVHPHCPIAINISELVDFFKDGMSYERLDVRVSTDERSYVKETTMTEAVSSLLGIYMVTSGCPVMDKLRPMVRFHLPLATAEETTFRALAMYLVAQYFLAQRGEEPDWELRGLPGVYEEVQVVNQSFANRLRAAGGKDASPNALVRLDTFASTILMSLDFDKMENLEALFESYLPRPGGGP